MRFDRPRIGLSFEVMRPPAARPLRTDIACFVGNVARRRRPAKGAQALPAVIMRWLTSHQVEQIGGVPLTQIRVSLAAKDFVEGVLALASDSERAALREFFADQTGGGMASAFCDLLTACDELTPVPEVIVEDLRLREFQPRGHLGTNELAAWLRVQRLHNLPVAIERFEDFDSLFAWDRRAIDRDAGTDGSAILATPLGVALRAFFGEGGRRAYVIRTGDPAAVFDTAVDRIAACFPKASTEDRCPQFPGVRWNTVTGLVADAVPPAMSTADRVGLEHVYGLPDVSFALLPDVIDACVQDAPPPKEPEQPAPAPVRFADCADETPPPNAPAGRTLSAPLLDFAGLNAWRRLLVRALTLLDNPGRAFHRRDVQLLASLPMVSDGRDLPAPSNWLEWMARTPGWLERPATDTVEFSSDRLQLAYPWVRTRESDDAQGGIEAPEGSLAGVLARSALERGSYRSAATRPLNRYLDSEPALSWTQATQQTVWTPQGWLSLAERVCLLGPSPRGPQLLSDVTCSADARIRQASVRRLMNVVIQAARNMGDEFAFEANGEALWSRVRERMSDLMRVLLAGGALSSDGVPFEVSCGRDTMRQNDIDAGRLIVKIEVQPAQPVQRIVVVMNLRDAAASPAFASAA